MFFPHEQEKLFDPPSLKKIKELKMTRIPQVLHIIFIDIFASFGRHKTNMREIWGDHPKSES